MIYVFIGYLGRMHIPKQNEFITRDMLYFVLVTVNNIFLLYEYSHIYFIWIKLYTNISMNKLLAYYF